MAIRRFSGSSLTTGSKSSKLWDQETTLGTFESIATATSSGSDASITFSGIPQNYTHLQIRGNVQTNRATYGSDALFLRVGNGTIDTGANYSWHNLYGCNSTAAANGSASATSNYILNSGCVGTSTGGSFGAIIVDLLDYTSVNKNKTIRVVGGTDDNANTGGFGNGVGINSSSWFPSTPVAITTVLIAPLFGSLFTAYTTFALYGIRGA